MKRVNKLDQNRSDVHRIILFVFAVKAMRVSLQGKLKCLQTFQIWNEEAGGLGGEEAGGLGGAETCPYLHERPPTCLNRREVGELGRT